MGFEIEHRREDFDLDEDEPLRADAQRARLRRPRRAQPERSLVGRRPRAASTRRRSTTSRSGCSPARRSNTTCSRIRSTRAGNCASATPSGPYFARYREETLLFTFSDTMAQQEASVTLDQREPWGSLQAEFEYSTFLPDASLLPHPARRRRQRAAGARAVTVHRGQHEPASAIRFPFPAGV